MVDDRSGAQRSPAATARIRELNDRLRRTGKGGQVVISAGVAALPAKHRAEALQAVRGYDEFDEPDDEHDLGFVIIPGPCFVFEIKSFDLAMQEPSPDPADPAVTCRVLTIMLADEMPELASYLATSLFT